MAQILSIASAPGNFVPQQESFDHAALFSCQTERQKKILQRLYRRTEIDYRSTILVSEDRRAVEQLFPSPDCGALESPGTARRMEIYDYFAKQLATRASHEALRKASVHPDQITHLVSVSCTGFKAPGFDIEVVKQLGLNRSVHRTHIGFMGCHGTMNALRVARGFLQLHREAHVLLCATEICSAHFQYGWTPDDLVANSLFADGAASLVMSNSPGIMSYVDSMSYLVDESESAMTWAIGDNGFRMTLSAEVPSLIENTLPDLVEQWLKMRGLSISDIGCYAVHPGGPRILDAVAKCLDLAPEALDTSREILAQCGNMSSPTVLFIIEKLLEQNRNYPCLALAFGPGLTIEAALLARS